MLQFQQHLFRAVFFTNDVMCHGHYDLIYHPFPIDSQYLKNFGGLTALIGLPTISKSFERRRNIRSFLYLYKQAQYLITKNS